MRIELDDREVEVLADAVRQRVTEYSAEIHHARTTDFRADLRDRKKSLESVLEKLEERTERR